MGSYLGQGWDLIEQSGWEEPVKESIRNKAKDEVKKKLSNERRQFKRAIDDSIDEWITCYDSVAEDAWLPGKYRQWKAELLESEMKTQYNTKVREIEIQKEADRLKREASEKADCEARKARSLQDPKEKGNHLERAANEDADHPVRKVITLEEIKEKIDYLEKRIRKLIAEGRDYLLARELTRAYEDEVKAWYLEKELENQGKVSRPGQEAREIRPEPIDLDGLVETMSGRWSKYLVEPKSICIKKERGHNGSDSDSSTSTVRPFSHVSSASDLDTEKILRTQRRNTKIIEADTSDSWQTDKKGESRNAESRKGRQKPGERGISHSREIHEMLMEEEDVRIQQEAVREQERRGERELHKPLTGEHRASRDFKW
ncbi:MAG: hypothetical protein Q9220_004155 [cf. Caloplaca sp. 1 TL-2023]